MSCPNVSIIIPTYSRPAHLLACLETISAQEYEPSRLEVVVVDDGSPQDLSPIIERLRDRLNLIFVRQSNSGPAAARNVGFACSSGEIIAFTDDDCRPQQDWVRQMVNALGAHRQRLVGGRTENLLRNNLYSQASQCITEYLYDYYAKQHTEMRFFTTNNVACFREAFTSSHGFCTKFFSSASEDRDFCNRWFKSGKELFYAPNAVVGHSHELNLKSFWRQHFNYGRGAYTFHKLRALTRGSSIKIEPIEFYANLIKSPLPKQINAAYTVSGLVAVSQFANACGFFAQLTAEQIRATEKRHPLEVIAYEVNGTTHSLELPVIAH